MIKVVVAYDDIDINLGTYFEECKEQILSVLEEQGDALYDTPLEIPGNSCRSGHISAIIPQYNQNPFIFIAYSHGNEKALCCNGDNYVEKDINTHHFVNSLFYTTTCSAGKELGKNLISKGCLAFIGYNRNINVYSKDYMRRISKNCDNAGIIAFFMRDITIFEAFESMKRYYEQKIDELVKFNDMLLAADMAETKEALVFFGDPNLKKENLISP